MDIITSIKTKADAMAFAIEQSGGDLGRADQIYRMFVDNMELPDAEGVSADLLKEFGQSLEAVMTWINTRDLIFKKEKSFPGCRTLG